MDTEVKIVIPPGVKKLLKGIKFLDAALFAKIGSFAEEQILNRTAASKDVKGGALKPYSESYKKTRQKAGLPIKPDLFFTGKMLGALTSKSEKSAVQVYFADKEQAEKAYFNNKKREFFGLNETDEQAIREIVNQHIAGILNGL